MRVRQAVILCGGLGTRLGQLTSDTPKPLLHVDGVPFLEILIREVSRSGIRRFLLLAGHLSHQIQAFASDLQERLGSGYSIEVNVEREPAGTGGALFEAKDRLDEAFALLNGDSFLDLPLHELAGPFNDPDILGAIALRHVDDVSRYGGVSLEGDKVAQFVEKSGEGVAGLINGGVYLLRKRAIDLLSPGSSLERDFLPKLALEGKLSGKVFDGFFIDIGLPETYREAGSILTQHRRRPAVFLDRDGVLNRDAGHVGTLDRWEWIPGAVEAIRDLNHRGFYVFVVTNQAGIAKGKFELEHYWQLRDSIRDQLFEAHAQIDDERFCPFHPEGTVEEWRKSSDWRKPGPGMINDLIATWAVDVPNSFLVGDMPSDLDAASRAGVRSYLFTGGNLQSFVKGLLLDNG